MSQAAHVQELFHEEAHQGSLAQPQPWWKIQLFVWEPVLFGTWDGVFTSCMINIFGVVLFLRTGWLVGNTGVVMGMILVSFVILVALVTVLSGIGVGERCSVGSGGVYSMISSVLGGRLGGTFGLLYVFGQCVAGAMYITGFAESMAAVLGLRTIWAVRGISLAVLAGLLGINLAGVKWIVRLQLLLLFLLAVSTLDFVAGSFTHLDPDHGFVGYSPELLQNNTLPDYSPGESFFTVFGVFFPAATGVMAGFNMAGDLREPESNIPLGSLAAVGISWFLYIIFVFLLGAICTRESLRYDFMIAEKVSLVGFLFLLGLYISSLASCMGGLYGAPRILQCIAQEKVVPALAFLGHGRGPNKTPVAAICLSSLVTVAFILVGQVNALAPIVTINFMLTYIAVHYSFFSLHMSGGRLGPTAGGSEPLALSKGPGYGSGGTLGAPPTGTLLEFTRDMDRLFHFPTLGQGGPRRPQRDGLQERKRPTPRKAPAQTLQESFLLDLPSPPSSSSPQEFRPSAAPFLEGQEQGFPRQTSSRDRSEPSSQTKQDCGDQVLDGQPSLGPHRPDPFPKLSSQEQDVERRPVSFYTQLCNPWVSLFGAIGSLTIMFVIQWIYALVDIGVAVILYFYIGQVSPGLHPGAAANYSLFRWIKSLLIPSFREREMAIIGDPKIFC
uniref:Solute carrier family 12 member 8 n=1 Tax=Monodelphis domestica TaxID=13616 RepID=A0A5F8HFT4_MONDO